uniref:cyclin-dependent kinase-like 5 n=1 Tax=Semicossyphus pulcher TaxID=241346 RepID=UPI0037E9325D
MERYESLGLVGEGSYGTVLKCRHRDSGRLVAIKKFMDSDDDKTVKKIALREIKLLRQLRHDNLVNLLEVWKRRRRWYLVFEFVERTLLDDLEQNPNGLDLNTSRQYLFQILRAVAFCHQQSIIHRDIKPENILISQGGVVKLCDFGFARTMTTPTEGGVYTDYVATRWYRAPELLVGDTKYGKPVDVWAVGCLLLEMLTGQPLFPGDSDLDQIYHIVRCFGNLTAHHQELFYRNPVFSGVKLPQCSGRVPLEQRFTSVQATALDVAQNCLQMDPESRAQCSELLEHPLFTNDSFHIRFSEELNAKIQKHHRENSTFPKIAKTQRREKDEGDDKNRRGKEKKHSEDPEEKLNKEIGKRDKEGGEDKLPKTKGKQPSKQKNVRNTSEPLMSTKQSKTSAAKIFDNAAKTTKSDHGQTTMRSKPEKSTGVELSKKSEISKPTKTLNFDAYEASKTAMDLKDNNTSMEIQRSKFEPGQSSTISNTKVLKVSKSSTTGHTNESLSPKAYLKSAIDHTDTNLPQKIGKIFTKEYTEAAATAVTSKISNSDQVDTSFRLKVSQPSSNDHIESITSTIPSVAKPCKTTTASEHQANCSNMDTEQRGTSESPKVSPSNSITSKTTSNSCPKLTKDNTSLSTSPSKTLTSDLSAQSSTVFIKGSLPHRNTSLPKGTLQTGSSSDTKPTNSITCVPNKLSTSLHTEKEPAQVLIATVQGTCTSIKNIKKNHRCLTSSPVTRTAAKHSEISDVSSGDYEENPESLEPSRINSPSTSMSKINTKSGITSTSLTDEFPNTKTPVATTIPKTLEVSDKENREVLSLSVSISPTTKSLANHISKVSRGSNTEQAEPNVKSLRPPHSKSLIGEPKTKLGSFSNHTKPPAAMTPKTPKTAFPTEATNKRENSERNDSTNVSTISDSNSFTPTATPDHNASMRILHNMYTADVREFDFSVPNSSPPPPPPPPSSTPLLLPPSTTPLVPSISDVHSPAASDHFALGASFHPGTHSLRGTDKPRHPGGIYSRLNQLSLSSHISGTLTSQVSEKSQICEHSFLSERFNVGNSSGVTVTKKRSDIHFPDLRSSVLPERKGREGKLHNKGISKDQRKDKQLVPSISSSDPQKLGHNSTDTQTL